MMKNIVKCCLGLSLAILLAGAWVVPADAYGEVRYPDRTLNLRAERDAGSEWVGLLFPGQPVKVAELKDGWVAVLEPDATDGSRVAGYANVKYLKKIKGKVEIKPWGELRRSKGVVNLRKSATQSAEVVGQLQAGQRVRVDFPEEDWVAVFPDTATIRSSKNALGYSMVSLLEAVGNEASTPAPAAPAVAAPAPQKPKALGKPWGRILVAPGAVPLHKNRTVASPVTVTLTPGDRVKIGLQTGDWYAVFLPGESEEHPSKALGYASLDVLEGRSVATLTEPGVRQAVAPAPAPKPKVEPVAPVEPLQEPKAVPAPAATPETRKAEPEKSDKVEMVIRPDQLKSAPRPAPATDQTAHGFKYKIFEQEEVRSNGQPITRVKVYLDMNRIPAQAELKDFARTIWSKLRRRGKEMVVHLYVPDMDLDDIAYISASFDEDTMVEFWERKTALFGTRFQK